MYVWVYEVREESIDAFEKVYGSLGEWVNLFRRAIGYIRTELHRDVGDPNRYVTIDYWDDEESCLDFREEFAAEFEELDKRCESLTIEETRIGSFSLVE